MASQIQIPDEKSSATWLAPMMASLPNMLMSKASRMTSTIMGMREMASPDSFLFFISRGSSYIMPQVRNFFIIFMQDFANEGFSG